MGNRYSYFERTPLLAKTNTNGMLYCSNVKQQNLLLEFLENLNVLNVNNSLMISLIVLFTNFIIIPRFVKEWVTKSPKKWLDLQISPIDLYGMQVFCQKTEMLYQKFETFDFTHNGKKSYLRNKISNPNPKCLTHWLPLGGFNDLENDCTKNLYIHFELRKCDRNICWCWNNYFYHFFEICW